MDILLSLFALLLALTGIVGCIVPMIPGPALSYAGLLVLGACGYAQFGAPALWGWFAATAAVTAADYLLPAWLTRLFGGSRAGEIGATVGIFAGIFLGGAAGMLIGPFAGAVAGELLHNRNDLARALRVGAGSFFSFVIGTGVKLAVSIGIFLRIWSELWPVARAWVAALWQ